MFTELGVSEVDWDATPQSVKTALEYRRHTLACAACGVKTEAEWSEEMPAGRFGARLQASVAYLTGRLGLSHRDGVEALRVLDWM